MSAKKRPKPMAIRKGAKSVFMENSDSDAVLFFDLANVNELCDVRFLHHYMYGKGAERVKAVNSIAERGLIVFCELEEKDDLRVEVVVGAPLSKRELSQGHWLAPQRARLNVPSGRLAINAFPALRSRKDVDPSRTPEGVILPTIQVPPGDYVFALYRPDVNALKKSGRRRGPLSRPVVVLTPVGKTSPVEKPVCILEHPLWVADVPPVPPEVTGDTWRGSVLASEPQRLVVELDKKAAEDLGLRFGMGLRLEAGEVAADAIYLGDLEVADYLRYHGDGLFGSRPDLLATEWHGYTCKYRADELLCFTAEQVVPALTTATVRVLPEPVIPYDVSWSTSWVVNGGEVSGFVLRCIPKGDGKIRHLLVNLGPKALAAIGAKPGDRLDLMVGAATRPVLLYEDEKAWVEAYVDEEVPNGSKSDVEQRPYSACFEKHWYAPEEKILMILPPKGKTFDFPVADGTAVRIRLEKKPS